MARPKRPLAPKARAQFKAKLGRAPSAIAQRRGETKPPSRRPAPPMRPDPRLDEGTRKPADPIPNPPAGARSLSLRSVCRAPKAFGKRIGPDCGGPEACRPALAFFRRCAVAWACARPAASRAVHRRVRAGWSRPVRRHGFGGTRRPASSSKRRIRRRAALAGVRRVKTRSASCPAAPNRRPRPTRGSGCGGGLLSPGAAPGRRR